MAATSIPHDALGGVAQRAAEYVGEWQAAVGRGRPPMLAPVAGLAATNATVMSTSGPLDLGC
jgi:hypothetical protein